MPASYSYNWSRRVVRELTGKYPRASEFVKKLLEITEDNLIAYLASNDPMWPHLRSLMHFVDQMYQYGSQQPDTVTIVKYLRENPFYKTDLRLMKRLDKLYGETDTRRAGIRGVSGGLLPDGNLPLFPELENSSP